MKNEINVAVRTYNNENHNDNKQIIITSKKVKGDEMVIKDKSNREQHILQKNKQLSNEKMWKRLTLLEE